MKRVTDSAKEMMDTEVNDARVLLEQALERFNAAVASGDNPAVVAARAEVERLRRLIKDVPTPKVDPTKLIDKAGQGGLDAGRALAENFKKGAKVDFILASSTEAWYRAQEQREKLAGGALNPLSPSQINAAARAYICSSATSPAAAPAPVPAPGQPGAPNQPAAQAAQHNAQQASMLEVLRAISAALNGDATAVSYLKDISERPVFSFDGVNFG